MGTAYFSRKDIMLRLCDTICFYDGLPYYVQTHENSDNNVTIYRFADVERAKNGMVVDYTDPKFNYKSPALGYFHYNKKDAVYVSRLPDRQQSQGLNSRVLRLKGAEINRYETYYLTPEFEDMLLNRYVGSATAFNLIASGVSKAVPISRNVALSQTRRGLIEVFFKGRPVACNFKSRGIELYDLKDANYMAKTLASHGIHIGA